MFSGVILTKTPKKSQQNDWYIHTNNFIHLWVVHVLEFRGVMPRFNELSSVWEQIGGYSMETSKYTEIYTSYKNWGK